MLRCVRKCLSLRSLHGRTRGGGVPKAFWIRPTGIGAGPLAVKRKVEHECGIENVDANKKLDG